MHASWAVMHFAEELERSDIVYAAAEYQFTLALIGAIQDSGRPFIDESDIVLEKHINEITDTLTQNPEDNPYYMFILSYREKLTDFHYSLEQPERIWYNRCA